MAESESKNHPEYEPDLDDPEDDATDEVEDDGDYWAETVDDGEEDEEEW
jgi:hypothetical protein